MQKVKLIVVLTLMGVIVACKHESASYHDEHPCEGIASVFGEHLRSKGIREPKLPPTPGSVVLVRYLSAKDALAMWARLNRESGDLVV